MNRKERDERISSLAQELFDHETSSWSDKGAQLFALELIQIRLGDPSNGNITKLREIAHDKTLEDIKRLHRVA